MRETELYQPVKALLEGQGYEVKGEVGAADIVGVRGDEPPVIVELKTAFSLSLFHQAIERLKLSDSVYVAVPHQTGRKFYAALKANTTLCRRPGDERRRAHAATGRNCAAAAPAARLNGSRRPSEAGAYSRENGRDSRVEGPRDQAFCSQRPAPVCCQ